MSRQTYIYDKKEYIKTGRTATKKEFRGRRMGTSGTHENSFMIKELVEIRPVSVPEDNTEFNLWVDATELFEVSNE